MILHRLLTIKYKNIIYKYLLNITTHFIWFFAQCSSLHQVSGWISSAANTARSHFCWARPTRQIRRGWGAKGG